MSPSTSQREQSKGLIAALAAFFWWGFMPVYFKSVGHVAVLDVLISRIVWGFVFLLLVIRLLRNDPRELFARLSARALFMTVIAAVALGCNWLTYIWAVGEERVLETSVGYFINPLVNVLFGRMFFGERLRRTQAVALVLAAVGVSIQVIRYGKVPWVALVLAVSFAIYGSARKGSRTGALTGLLAETSWLLPGALAVIAWRLATHVEGFGRYSAGTWLLLLAAGPITVIPLLFFAMAAKRLSLTALGLVQYLSPSCQFLLAVLIYREPFSVAHFVSFVFIWAALALFSTEQWQRAGGLGRAER